MRLLSSLVHWWIALSAVATDELIRFVPESRNGVELRLVASASCWPGTLVLFDDAKLQSAVLAKIARHDGGNIYRAQVVAGEEQVDHILQYGIPGWSSFNPSPFASLKVSVDQRLEGRMRQQLPGSSLVEWVAPGYDTSRDLARLSILSELAGQVRYEYVSPFATQAIRTADTITDLLKNGGARISHDAVRHFFWSLNNPFIEANRHFTAIPLTGYGSLEKPLPNGVSLQFSLRSPSFPAHICILYLAESGYLQVVYPQSRSHAQAHDVPEGATVNSVDGLLKLTADGGLAADHFVVVAAKLPVPLKAFFPGNVYAAVGPLQLVDYKGRNISADRVGPGLFDQNSLVSELDEIPSDSWDCSAARLITK